MLVWILWAWVAVAFHTGTCLLPDLLAYDSTSCIGTARVIEYVSQSPLLHTADATVDTLVVVGIIAALGYLWGTYRSLAVVWFVSWNALADLRMWGSRWSAYLELMLAARIAAALRRIAAFGRPPPVQ